MMLTCNNKGCFATDFHQLNESTDEVICTKCHKPINATRVAKSVLKNSKQVVKVVRSENEVNCESCGATAPPVVKKYGPNDTRILCAVCGEVNKRQTRFFADVWKNRPGVEVIRATPEEKAEAGQMRFNKVPAKKLEEAPVEKVKEGSLDDSFEPLEAEVTELPLPKLPKPNSADSSQADKKASKLVPPAEARARKRAEALANQDLVVQPKHGPSEKVTNEDIAISGLDEFAGD